MAMWMQQGPNRLFDKLDISFDLEQIDEALYSNRSYHLPNAPTKDRKLNRSSLRDLLTSIR